MRSVVREFPCEIEAASAVLVGNFNPAIFHPGWFERQGLLSRAQAEGANVAAVLPELAQFSLEHDRIHVQVLPNRLTVTGTPDLQEELHVLVVETFKILEHTPLNMLGINYNMHFRMPSDDAWHTVGHRLAPKEIWEELLDTPGTRSVTIQGKRPGSRAKHVRVTVEPSVQVLPGVYFAVNEHFDRDEKEPSSVLLDALREEWQPAIEHARTVGREILTRAMQNDAPGH